MPKMKWQGNTTDLFPLAREFGQFGHRPAALGAHRGVPMLIFFSPSILKRMPVLLTKYELRLYYNGVGKRRARIRRVADDSVSNQHWIPIRPTLKMGRHFGFINVVMVLKKKFDQFSGFSCINQDNRDFRTTSLTVNVILNSQVSLKTQTPRHKSK